MNILIAEDNPVMQMINRRMMDHWGYDFDMASNGLEAVEYAQKNEGKYDLCLMNVEMPIMDGIKAAAIIRRKVKYFPIMALSANSGYRGKCLEAGMDDFMATPCPMNKLFAKLNELMVKSLKFEFKGNDFFIEEEMPVDRKHADELRALAKEGLCKMNIIGIGPHDVKIVAHKNVPYKISQDFIGNNAGVSIFLDRSKDKPAECHLYKSSCPMPAVYLTEENYEEKRKKEDELLENCTTMVIKKNEE